MANSQETATAAALCQLEIRFKTVDTVQATVKGMPAAGVLRAGDVITAVDGTPVTCQADAGTLIKARKPGAPVAADHPAARPDRARSGWSPPTSAGAARDRRAAGGELTCSRSA